MKLFLSLNRLFTATALICATGWAEPADDLIKAGDDFGEKLQASEALKCYLAAEKLQPDNAQLFAHIAREYRHLMSDAAKREDKLKLGGIALCYAQRAAKLAPNDAEAQLAPAIAYGRLLPLQGKREQVEASRRIKESAERALRLDPRNDTAWHVLGRWHQVIADVGAAKRALGSLIYGKLPTTTNEEAVRCFQQAIKLNPTRLMHYIELGRTYAQMGRDTDARRLIAKGLAMPDVEKDDPTLKQRAREMLAKLHG